MCSRKKRKEKGAEKREMVLRHVFLSRLRSGRVENGGPLRPQKSDDCPPSLHASSPDRTHNNATEAYWGTQKKGSGGMGQERGHATVGGPKMMRQWKGMVGSFVMQCMQHVLTAIPTPTWMYSSPMMMMHHLAGKGGQSGDSLRLKGPYPSFICSGARKSPSDQSIRSMKMRMERGGKARERASPLHAPKSPVLMA